MNVISNNGYHRWKSERVSIKRRKMIKINKSNNNPAYLGGFVNLNGLLLIFVFIVGFLYLYSMNGSAVQGYEINQIEEEINVLREEADELKIREAELNSLYRLEEERGDLEMEEVDDVVYVHNSDSIALK